MRKTTTYALLGAAAAFFFIRGVNKGLFGAEVQGQYLNMVRS